MAKLDKQGLNTFIRELDKHINTKINRLDISPTAEKVIMANGSNVETTVTTNKSNISILQSNVNNNTNEIQSLKQSVSNGKILIASAITDKGVETSKDSTFEQMANNIGEIKTFKYVSFYEKVLYTDSTEKSTSSSSQLLAHTYIADVDCGLKATVKGRTGNSNSSGTIYLKHYRGDELIKTVSLYLNGKTSYTALSYTSDNVLAGDEIRSYVSWSSNAVTTIKDLVVVCSLQEV